MGREASTCRLPAAILALGLLIPGCARREGADEPGPPRDTMAAIGRRLGASRSVEDLTAIAAQGHRLLAELTARERDALGRGHLRLEVDRPAVVAIAASGRCLPFWLDDQGFRRTGATVDVRGEAWPLFERTFKAGRVGLGVNALDRSAAEHYAVFVRAADPGRGPVSVRAIAPERAAIVPAAEGVTAALDGNVPLRRLPDELHGSMVVQVPRDLRHATALARGRVWKTHVASGQAPDQVAIAFGADPSRELSWSWRTHAEVARAALRLKVGGDGPDDPESVAEIAAESRLVESPDLLNDPRISRHTARAVGLQPGTTYAYSLGDGSPGGWTPWRTIRTAPARPGQFRFLYLGDAQCGLEAWGKLLQAAHQRHNDSAFLLLAGDLVDRGNERTNWDHFFLRARGVFEELPFMPCVGNHEYLDRGPRLYSAFFALPGNGPSGIDRGLVYSFEYGNAFVAVLDSTLALSDRNGARIQAGWLDSALSRTEADWKLVMFHHPVYASHATREYPTLAEDWVPTFDKHHVDLVLQGHDHAYLRTYPMCENRRVNSNAEGTTYVVSVSGEKFSEQARRDYAEVAFANTSTYQTIDVDAVAGRLTYRAWDRSGREVDRLVIEKPAQTPARVAAALDPSRSGPAPDAEHGDRVPAALRELLGRPRTGPVGN